MNNNYYDPKSNEINLIEYWQVIKRHKKIIIFFVSFVTTAAVVVSLLLPKEYQSNAEIMPISSGGSDMAAMASQLGGLSFLGEMIISRGDSTTRQFLAILRSRKFVEVIIKQLDLIDILQLDKANMEDIVALVKGHISIKDSEKKGGTIVISSTFQDPELAAKVANGYVEELQKFISSSTFTSAKRNRIFIKGQLEGNKRELLEVGRELNEFYKEGRVSDVNSRVDVAIDEPSNYEFDTGILDLGTAADISADIDRDKIWEKIEKSKEKINNEITKTKVVKNVPQQVYLQYLAFRRELLNRMNALLTQQYEIAKIGEAKEDLAFQIIDPAYVPQKRFKPKRKQIVMMSFAISLFFSIFLAFGLEYIEKIKKSPAAT